MSLIHLVEGDTIFCPTSDNPPEMTEDATLITCLNCMSMAGQITADVLRGGKTNKGGYGVRWLTRAGAERRIGEGALEIARLEAAVVNGYYRLDAVAAVQERLTDRSRRPGSTWAVYGDLWRDYGVKRGWLDEKVREHGDGVRVSVILETKDGQAYYSVADVLALRAKEQKEKR